MRAFYFILVAFACVAVSCQKEISEDIGNNPGNPANPGNKQCLLTRIVQGTGVDDTVFLVKYDAQNRIHAIIDSAYEDSVVATYTGNNKYPDMLEDSYGDAISYTYNASGKPLVVSGGGNKIVMEYLSDTILSNASSYYHDNTWKLSRLYTFQFDSKVNMSSMREFTSGNDLRGQTDITYTDIPNGFNGLAPYNFNNMLGMDDIFPAFMFLYNSKYLVKSALRGGGGQIFTVSYQQNSDHQVISSKAVLKEISTGEVLFVVTRYYFYQCP